MRLNFQGLPEDKVKMEGRNLFTTTFLELIFRIYYRSEPTLFAMNSNQKETLNQIKENILSDNNVVENLTLFRKFLDTLDLYEEIRIKLQSEIDNLTGLYSKVSNTEHFKNLFKSTLGGVLNWIDN